MIQIVELSFQNFVDFHQLLLQRGEAPYEYYKWKYLDQPCAKFPPGFIAYQDGVSVGCIGLINRVYVDEKGERHNATWFADWFVSSNSRGTGIGLALMRKVEELTSFSFGIPGPRAAQIIAEKAGYSLKDSFYEIRMVARPWNYGFYLRNDGFYKRIFRAVKYKLIQPKLTGINSFHVSKFNVNNIKVSKTALDGLLKDKDYFNWLVKMPTSLSSKREYWILDIEDTQIIFFTEYDLTQLKRARILDVISNTTKLRNLYFILNWAKPFSKLGVDYYQVYMHLPETPKVHRHFFKAEAQYSTFLLSKNFQLSIADKESRWRDFYL